MNIYYHFLSDLFLKSSSAEEVGGKEERWRASSRIQSTFQMAQLSELTQAKKTNAIIQELHRSRLCGYWELKCLDHNLFPSSLTSN